MDPSTLDPASLSLDFDVAALVWGFVFSTVGLAYFIYGKKRGRAAPLWCGVALMAYPYFVDRVLWLVLIGLALGAVPWFVRD